MMEGEVNVKGGWRLARKFVVAFGMLLVFGSCLGLAQKRDSRMEEIEWTWEVRPAHVDEKLPNVLLLGDSITRAYFPEVQKGLAGAANVYLMATSASVGDPRLVGQIEEFSAAEGVAFGVVHFNNGMHGWEYSEAEYRAAFPAFLAEIRLIAPKAALIWATTTPVKQETEPGPTNARVVARNAVADAAIRDSGMKPAIVTDDQYQLMVKHAELYKDFVHFNDEGAALQGKQAAESIRRVLGLAGGR